MACVHRLKHVECLAASAFANDDPVRTHSKAVLDEIADRHRTLAFHVRGACLQPYDVRLDELEFCGVLDGHDSLGFGDEGRKKVQKGGLSGAGSTGDDDILAELDAHLHECGGVCVPCAEADEIFDRKRLLRELADGD